MVKDDVTVRRHIHVELQHVDPKLQSMLKCRNRVFRTQCRAPAMRDDFRLTGSTCERDRRTDK
jgi:hypothetical protein